MKRMSSFGGYCKIYNTAKVRKLDVICSQVAILCLHNISAKILYSYDTPQIHTVRLFCGSGPKCLLTLNFSAGQKFG